MVRAGVLIVIALALLGLAAAGPAVPNIDLLTGDERARVEGAARRGAQPVGFMTRLRGKLEWMRIA